MTLEPGRTATVSHTVEADDLATAIGSGEVDVLSTPMALALCERATMAVLDGLLETDETSVAMRVHLDHVQPTALGVNLVADATLERIEGRRLTFLVNLLDGDVVVATGRVTRVTVERSRFLARLRSVQ